MSKVSINAPKTPVTKGSRGLASATLPNVCKMPGPPAPFVPTPLPNIGKSDLRPEGYSKSVTIEGHAVAIAGSSFGSIGDVASKGTGGGIVSNNAEGQTKFIGPGSFDVQIEGKNVQLLGDPMLNNCGPAGSPANAATMTGVVQADGTILYRYGDDYICDKCKKVHEPIPPSPPLRTRMNELFYHLNEVLEAQMADIRKTQQEFAGLRMSLARPPKPEELTLFPVALLNFVPSLKTFAGGYMVGVIACQCPNAKMIAACSGRTPPGFKSVVQSMGMVCAEDSQASMPGWPCAAKKLVLTLGKHHPGFLLERWFAPATVNADFTGEGPLLSVEVIQRSGERARQDRRPRNAQEAPSCDKCQGRVDGIKGLPFLYCGNDECTKGTNAVADKTA
jgi:hypothetical protein